LAARGQNLARAAFLLVSPSRSILAFVYIASWVLV
jgi:hypothetical protein